MFYKLNKKKKRVSPLSFKLPASNAITTPTLAQVIGQFGFNMQEILSTFNKKSIIYSKGIKVTTLLFLMPNKK
jgi:ribosomal protein L11